MAPDSSGALLLFVKPVPGQTRDPALEGSEQGGEGGRKSRGPSGPYT